MINCSCNERMQPEDVEAHRREGCPQLEESLRKLADKRRWGWMDEALCGGYDVAWFVPDAGSRRSPSGSGPEVEGIRFNRLTHGERLAKSQWCVRCPVREECLGLRLLDEIRTRHLRGSDLG